MCIMFITNKKIGLPTADTLDHMFTSNPHGGGLACVHTDADGKRFISMEKGLMTKEAFVKSVADHFTKLNTDSDYLIVHTRITTSGGTSPSKTHPFKMPSGGFLFQNGISYTAEKKMHKSESDTEWLAKNAKDMDEIKKIDGISRFVIINPDGSLTMTANWVKDKDGRHWSNSGYTPYTSALNGYSNTYWQNHGYGYVGEDDHAGPYVQNECATRTVYASPKVATEDYGGFHPQSSVVLKILEKLYDVDDALKDITEMVKKHKVYQYKDMLYSGGQILEVSLRPDKTIAVHKVIRDGDMSYSDMGKIRDEVIRQLMDPINKDILFFDKDLGDSIGVGIKITQCSIYRVSNVGYNVDVDYHFTFSEQGSTVPKVYENLLHGDLYSNTYTILDSESENLVYTIATMIIDGILENPLDEDYYNTLVKIGDTDVSHKLTIKR